MHGIRATRTPSLARMERLKPEPQELKPSTGYQHKPEHEFGGRNRRVPDCDSKSGRLSGSDWRACRFSKDRSQYGRAVQVPSWGAARVRRNDWGGAQLVISPGRSDRVANLVIVSCEAFDNNPPSVPGRLLWLDPSLPGGTVLSLQLLGSRWIRHLFLTFGGMSKKSVPNELFMSWIQPARHHRKIRREMN